MAAYEEVLNPYVRVAFPRPPKLQDIGGAYWSSLGLRQFRCAETEKYPHVTFFFNDYRDEPFPGETRRILQSPKVATYDLQPEMSAPAVCAAVLERLAAKTLDLNAIGVVNIALGKPIPFAPYAESRELGGFILIDRMTNATVGAGLIHFALRRSQNIHWQAVDITREAHAAQKGQQAKLLWFTGLSGAGKSTIANLVEKKLHALGKHTFLLDGDNVRHGLNKDLGFTEADRVENIRRVGEVAKLMTDAGLIVLTAFISPFRAERQMVRAMLPEGDFIEVFVDTPLAEAEKRDVKGLYKKARAGQLRNFTGIDSPYEVPEAPEIRIDTTRMSPEDAADAIVERLLKA